MSDNSLKQVVADLCNSSSQDEILAVLSDFLSCEVTVAEGYYNKVKLNPDIQQKLVLPLNISSNNIAFEFNNISLKNKKLAEVLFPIVSLKLKNFDLTGIINQSFNYNNAMKNIAKIIESQYELSYIIPLIGEIMDTFLENHLVYIFLKQNNKMKLVWPKTCLDSNIHKKVSNMIGTKDVAFNKAKKIGYFPLVNENNSIGCLVTKSTQGELESQEVYQIQQLSKQIAITINRAKVYAEILKYATLDALTGFYNRHQMEERLKQEVSHAKRRGTSLCAIMTDIDFFKKVNDTYGHAAGDLVLKTVAKIIRGQLREYDIAARYGGEEFIILLPFTPKKEAGMVAERLRKAVRNKEINIEKVNTKNKEKTIKVTISLGVTEYNHTKQDAKDFLLVVDKALYASKESGRDKVVMV